MHAFRPLFRILAAAVPPLAAAVASPVRAEALERRFERDGVAVVVRVEPSAVTPDGSVELTLRTAAPASVRASLPESFDDRAEGFAVSGSFVDADGALHLNLSPVPGAPRLRLRPFPVTWEDASVSPPRTGWFATEPVDVAALPMPERPAAAPAHGLEPAFVWPSWQTVLRATLFSLAALAGFAALVWFGVRLARLRRLLKMSPRQRALLEYDGLMRRDLPGRGLFKDFHVELTMVVRRYLERRYGIRAPSLTTEEFLVAAKDSDALPPPTVGRLGAFLEASDLVKFAGVQTSVEASAKAAGTARAYLLAETEPPPEPRRRGRAGGRQARRAAARKEASK